ncbi:hypothetical protein [Persicobacter diffluens]|uniref:Uncharacterized protein n=1 Tax=Persicobacter diffluens TaxID=981 RepID=A0AAN4W3J7_9BACT|nr:hypothetical protein PEDI_50290 [Persicobacter diffluens]
MFASYKFNKYGQRLFYSLIGLLRLPFVYNNTKIELWVNIGEETVSANDVFKYDKFLNIYNEVVSSPPKVLKSGACLLVYQKGLM